MNQIDITCNADTIIKDPAVITFLEKAGMLGVGEEAAFIVTLMNCGEELLKKLTKTFKSDDDLSLAYLIYQKSHGEGIKDICKDDFRMLEILGKMRRISTELISLMDSITSKRTHTSPWRTPYPYSWKMPFYAFGIHFCPAEFTRQIDHRIQHYWLYLETDDPATPRLSDKPLYAIAALKECFVEAFAGSNLLYYIKTEAGYKCYSHTHLKTVEIAKGTAFKKMIPGEICIQLIAYKLEGRKKAMRAWFICTLPFHQKRNFIDDLAEHKLRIGPLFVTEICKQPGDLLAKSSGEFALINGHCEDDSTISVIASKDKFDIFAADIGNRVQQYARDEINWEVLRAKLDDCDAFVSFGLGFTIREVMVDGADAMDYSCTLKIDANKAYPGQIPSDVLGNLVDFVRDHCTKFEQAPLMFIHNDCLYVTHKSPAEKRQFLMQIERNELTFEIVPESLFEYLLSKDAVGGKHKAAACGRIPTKDGCVICANIPEGGDTQWIRLELCGHIYCDHCLIEYVKNAGTFPLRCSCEHSIGIQDIRVVFARSFQRIAELKAALLPTLQRSLDAILVDSKEFFRCSSAGCHKLLSASKCAPGDGDSLICPKCGWNKCKHCGDDPHPLVNCNQNRHNKIYANEENSKLLGWHRQDPTMRRICPNRNCNALIERAPEGCNHFECLNCKIHFCWLCDTFKARTSGEVYKHLLSVHGGSGIVGFEQLEALYGPPQIEDDWDDWDPPARPFDDDPLARYGEDEMEKAWDDWKHVYENLEFPW